MNDTDINTIISIVIQFFIFLFIHIVTTRKYGDQGVFARILRNFIGVGTAGSVVTYILLNYLSFPQRILVSGIIFCGYGILTFTYIMAIFGISLTSLRIQLLAEILQADGERVKLSDLIRKYNRATLIRQRLFRLESSGVIMKKNGKYFLKEKFSPYFLHIRIADFLYRLYK